MRSFTNFKSGFALASACIALMAAAPAHAGDGNTVYIEQNSTAGGLGNTLFVDQSNASNSTVGGDTHATMPAIQTGGNTASITLSGDGASVLLSQTNSNPLGANLNTGTITGDTLATIVLQQDGFGNVGSLDIGSGNNTGALFQYGESNTGNVTVKGNNSSGTLYQKGNGNTYNLEVTGGSGTSVQWNQVGNNLSASSVTPAQVISNAGTVTVTQSSY